MDTSAQRARFATRFAARRMPPADLGITMRALLGGPVPWHMREFPMRR